MAKEAADFDKTIVVPFFGKKDFCESAKCDMLKGCAVSGYVYLL